MEKLKIPLSEFQDWRLADTIGILDKSKLENDVHCRPSRSAVTYESYIRNGSIGDLGMVVNWDNIVSRWPDLKDEFGGSDDDVFTAPIHEYQYEMKAKVRIAGY